jgi:hypothetical protein
LFWSKNNVFEAKQNVFAAKTQQNHGSSSKFSFLINAAAGGEFIRVQFLYTRVQKLNSEEPKQWWNRFGTRCRTAT